MDPSNHDPGCPAARLPGCPALPALRALEEQL